MKYTLGEFLIVASFLISVLAVGEKQFWLGPLACVIAALGGVLVCSVKKESEG